MKLNEAAIYHFEEIYKDGDENNSLQSIIRTVSNKVINIPAYQRPYRWDEERINKLFCDIDDNKDDYFIGSAVFVYKKRNNQSVFDVVDGQQRLTTLFLLNYIRFLLKREYYHKTMSTNIGGITSAIDELEKTYYMLIGNNKEIFDEFKENSQITGTNQEELSASIGRVITKFSDILCIPKKGNVDEDTDDSIINSNSKLLQRDNTRLKYTRPRYNQVLTDSLCRVALFEGATDNYELRVV